jgi:hypothetical protein
LGSAVNELVVFGHDPGRRDARGEGQDPSGALPVDRQDRPLVDFEGSDPSDPGFRGHEASNSIFSSGLFEAFESSF